MKRFFAGFRLNGIILSFTSGALIGVGWKIINSKKILKDEDKVDLIITAIGTGCFTFSVYCFVPSIVRIDYSTVFEMLKYSDYVKLQDCDEYLDNIIIFIILDCGGLLFAAVTGSIVGVGYGVMKHDSYDTECTLYERVRQTAIGTSIYIAGLYAVSPSIVKCMWIGSYLITFYFNALPSACDHVQL